MKISPVALIEHARSDEGRKQIRYAAVAAVFVPLGQAGVQTLKWVFDVHAVAAVFITACVLTPPNYLSNKFYVWKHKSRDNQRTEIIVFWLAAIVGTAFAMGFVGLAELLVPDEQGRELLHAAAIFFAQLFGYGIVWVGRYLFLDRLIFKATHHGREPTDEVLDDLHRDFPV
jgi:putative flippase GtrA